MAFGNETLVLGGGPCAEQVATRLAAQGVAVKQVAIDGGNLDSSLKSFDDERIQRLEGFHLTGCQGQAGDFRVALAKDGKRLALTVSSIVVAEACTQIPNYDAYGLAPSSRVKSISELEHALKVNDVESIAAPHAQVVFLNTWTSEPNPVAVATSLRLCLHLQKNVDVRTLYLCGNLKVSGDGMEACYQEAKAAGTVFLKFARHFPVLARLDDDRIRIDCPDETTRMNFRMIADLIIVDDKILPHPELAHVADILRIDCDAFGFAQSDNVHRLANNTNRRGIFTAGGARAVLPDKEQTADAAHAALKVAEFLSDSDRVPLPQAQIDQGRCARCLTCYRLCPYAAIDTVPRMTINPAACQSCGLCTAGCPNRAIQIHDADLEEAMQRLAGQGTSSTEKDGFVPKVAAFCCSRSAAQARDLAMTAGHGLPADLFCIEGICGGTFSVHHLLSAIDAGMDGVMVLTCHEGNCHSETGTLRANKRTAEAIRLLSSAGVAAERIQFNNLAANMGSEFAQLVNGFAEKIQKLGPLMGRSI